MIKAPSLEPKFSTGLQISSELLCMTVLATEMTLSAYPGAHTCWTCIGCCLRPSGDWELHLLSPFSCPDTGMVLLLIAQHAFLWSSSSCDDCSLKPLTSPAEAGPHYRKWWQDLEPKFRAFYEVLSIFYLSIKSHFLWLSPSSITAIPVLHLKHFVYQRAALFCRSNLNLAAHTQFSLTRINSCYFVI